MAEELDVEITEIDLLAIIKQKLEKEYDEYAVRDVMGIIYEAALEIRSSGQKK